VDQADEDGRTPLWGASEGGHEGTVRLLLDRGAAVDQADEDGKTPLQVARSKGHEHVARLLLDRGALE
jgi:ankyrin repeat protein